jgi:hypothetical protein
VRAGDRARFLSHMSNEHEVHFDMEVLFAVSLMAEEEKAEVVRVMELKGGGEQEEVVPNGLDEEQADIERVIAEEREAERKRNNDIEKRRRIKEAVKIKDVVKLSDDVGTNVLKIQGSKGGEGLKKGGKEKKDATGNKVSTKHQWEDQKAETGDNIKKALEGPTTSVKKKRNKDNIKTPVKELVMEEASDNQTEQVKKFIKCKLCTKVLTIASYQKHIGENHNVLDEMDKKAESSVISENSGTTEKDITSASHNIDKVTSYDTDKVNAKHTKVKCTVCTRIFRDQRYLRMHESRGSCKETDQEKGFKLKCSTCSRCFKSKRKLTWHAKKTGCTLSENVKQEIRAKQKLERATFPLIRCKLCINEFQANNLARHLRTRHSEYEGLLHADLKAKYDAVVDGNKTGPSEEQKKSPDQIKRRLIKRPRTSNGNDTVVSCKLCSQQFQSRNLGRHLRMFHDGQSKETYAELPSAQTVVNPGPSKIITCKMCAKSLKAGSLKKHLRTYHKDVEYSEYKLMNSTIAEKLASPEDGQSGLLTANPTQFAISWCNICLQKVEQEIYEKHMEEHLKPTVIKAEPAENSEPTDDKLANCKLCYSTFKSDIGLERHIQRVHKDDMEALITDFTEDECIFQCPSCPQKFFTTNIRFHHVVSKHGASSGHPCLQCDKKFSKQPGLDKHMKRAHGQMQATPIKPTLLEIDMSNAQMVKLERPDFEASTDRAQSRIEILRGLLARPGKGGEGEEGGEGEHGTIEPSLYERIHGL